MERKKIVTKHYFRLIVASAIVALGSALLAFTLKHLTEYFEHLFFNKINNFRHALYVYLNHPQIGAILIKNLGNVKIAEIIAKHHQKINHKDSIELNILQRADNEN